MQHSSPQPKYIIVSLGLLAFICFCDGWGAGPPHLGEMEYENKLFLLT
jgi:hypothetical protein